MFDFNIILCTCSRDDRLPNLDATQAGPDTAENNEEFVPTGERKHFPSNITKTGYVIFSVSCLYMYYRLYKYTVLCYML